MSPTIIKVALRNLSVHLCRGLLLPLSRPYVPRNAPALILAPHQDDETLACGGLIARKRNQGCEVHVVFLTTGDASHPDHPSLSVAELVSLRRREAMQALGVLGVDSACVHFWEEPDGSLKSIDPARRARLVARLADLVRRVGPGRVFAPCSPDGSSEHDPVLGFITEAVDQSDRDPEIWQYPVWSWWNPVLMLGKLFDFGSAYRLPGEDFYPLKQRALGCYHSQIKPTPPWSAAALPPELMDFCLRDPEYFFRGSSAGGESRRQVI